jgi:hypothetical protein
VYVYVYVYICSNSPKQHLQLDATCWNTLYVKVGGDSSRPHAPSMCLDCAATLRGDLHVLTHLSSPQHACQFVLFFTLM